MYGTYLSKKKYIYICSPPPHHDPSCGWVFLTIWALRLHSAIWAALRKEALCYKLLYELVAFWWSGLESAIWTAFHRRPIRFYIILLMSDNMSSEARFCNLPELAEQSVLLFKFYINSLVSEGLGSGPRFCDLADLADGFPPSSSWIHVTIEFQRFLTIWSLRQDSAIWLTLRREACYYQNYIYIYIYM